MKSPICLTHSVRIHDLNVILDGTNLNIEANDTDSLLIGLYKSLAISYPKFYKMDTMSKTGFLASELLLKNTELNIESFKKGIILQNHSSSLDTDIRYQASIQDIPSPALFVYTLPNIVMGEIAIRHHLKGENTFFVSEEFSPEQLVNYTEILFQEGILDMAIVGYLEVRNNKLDVLMTLVQNEGNIPFSVNELNRLFQIS